MYFTHISKDKGQKIISNERNSNSTEIENDRGPQIDVIDSFKYYLIEFIV